MICVNKDSNRLQNYKSIWIIMKKRLICVKSVNNSFKIIIVLSYTCMFIPVNCLSVKLVKKNLSKKEILLFIYGYIRKKNAKNALFVTNHSLVKEIVINISLFTRVKNHFNVKFATDASPDIIL